MARPAAKFAISIPQPLYKALEKARRESRRSRSAIVQEALSDWLSRGVQAELVREYELGYRTRRETPAEALAALATATALMPKDEEW